MVSFGQLLLFVVLSSVAVTASLNAWRTRQIYGFFRFFAFEFLILLTVLNLHRWFSEPFSVRQIVSWIIIAGSTVLAAHGLILLRTVGKARARIMEETQTVVEVGVYRYIRHPVYASLILFGWGVFFKGVDLASGLLALMATGFWVGAARYEERFNINQFGEAYSDYMRRTKMFLPFPGE